MAEKLLKAKRQKVAYGKVASNGTFGKVAANGGTSGVAGRAAIAPNGRAVSTKPPQEIALVGTYKEKQLAWIKKNGVYNYPVKDGDEFDAAAFGKIKELWLYADAKGRRYCFAAEFVGKMTREDFLAAYPTYAKLGRAGERPSAVSLRSAVRTPNGRAVSPKPPHKAYYIFKTSFLDYGPKLEDPLVVARGADFGGRSAKVKKAIEAFKQGGEFGSLADFLPSELSQVPRQQLRVCEAAVQMEFYEFYEIHPSDVSQHSQIPVRTKFRFIDLFAGIGGIRLGFERAGNRCVFTSEWDRDAQETYSANWPGEPIFGDITKVDPNAIPDFDILCGGFPCQPFSSIGKRQGFRHPTQGTLFFNVRNIIAAKKPDAFFLENVPGLETHDGGRTISIVLNTLKDELGYDTSYAVLDAADYGVPQHRRRAFFVGYKKSLNAVFRFPEPTNAGIYADIQQYLETDAAIEEKALTDPKYKSRFAISKHLQDVYIWKKDDGHPQIIGSDQDEDPHVNLRHGPVKTLCASYHKIQRITGTFVKGGPTGLRMLTELECKRIQGFPDSFKIPVCKTSMYHQFGNSVAVPVIEAIARRMTDTLTECREKRLNVDAVEAVSITNLHQGGCSV